MQTTTVSTARGSKRVNENDLVSHMTLANDPHDGVMIENCHPPNHVNPIPSGKYNLVAIGAGSAGLVSAGGAGGLGAKAAIIERALMGGDCLVTGCVPSKAVIRAARAIYDLRLAREFGVQLSIEPQVDFAAAMERMRKLRAEISVNDSAARMREKYNVDVFIGEAKFVSPTEIEVDGQRLEFDRAVIATGGRAAELPIPGLKEAGRYTNENIFTITELPRRMVVIGGGPIGCELAQAFQRFGSAVILLNDAEHILPREDHDAAELIHRQLASEGVRVENLVKIVRVEVCGAEKVVVYQQAGTEFEVGCDLILSAAGRVPNVEGLNLEVAGVECSREGVKVDDFLRTSNQKIYAAGDVCSRFKFTHAADATARAVLRNAFFFGRARVSQMVMPWVTFTDPEIAHVGFYEADARAAGFDVATITEHFSDNDRAILDGETNGFARVHYDRKTGKILGGTIVARHAGEMISELTLAITHRLKLGALSTTIHPYPTQASVLQRIGDGYNRTRLSPTISRIFKKWFEWKRR